MMYEKRLLKELSNGFAFFTVHDYAYIWKRNRFDVAQAAQSLKISGKIKISKEGFLSLR